MATDTSRAARGIGLAYAAVGFALTHLIFALVIVFLLDWLPWPRVDGASSLGVPAAIAVDAVLIALFGLQHTGMARTAIKQISQRYLPAELERATYVHFANAALALLVLAWQPVPGTLWSVDILPLRVLIYAVFAAGWALSAFGSYQIDHLYLLGIRQAWSWFRGAPYVPKPFQRHWLYEHVRHPILVGLILAFFATPEMTVGHLVFAAGLTAYMLIGTHFEEKDLAATFGADYRAYRDRVPALIPRLRRRGPRSATAAP